MAVILVLDKVPRKGRKMPAIQRIVCDGYLLYSQKRGEEETHCRLQASQDGVSALGIARTMLAAPDGKDVYNAMKEELERMAEEAWAKRREARTKERKANDA